MHTVVTQKKLHSFRIRQSDYGMRRDWPLALCWNKERNRKTLAIEKYRSYMIGYVDVIDSTTVKFHGMESLRRSIDNL